MPYETAVHQWAAGLERLERAASDQRATLERVSGAVEDELRRRLGGPYTADELAALYDEGTAWGTDVAMTAAPEEPYAWDARVVVDAAFGRYLRGATDYVARHAQA
ncbi:MAG: hypothetical protein AVDCRST_MAG38-1479 [uncultured Solirubrobacteraceae bacterium]|uniref:Uncharacterized protein n=1 Tax=uncultured Solirubrobacteraceae bacterium TaxID=1162706 RepID=A0A6J4RKF7_9ACTN|nr:MAG: hypothetical protein AVDCRST_MAG38-1479 [uncultured Solirubrobacteraceae bacterium]